MNDAEFQAVWERVDWQSQDDLTGLDQDRLEAARRAIIRSLPADRYSAFNLTFSSAYGLLNPQYKASTLPGCAEAKALAQVYFDGIANTVFPPDPVLSNKPLTEQEEARMQDMADEIGEEGVAHVGEVFGGYVLLDQRFKEDIESIHEAMRVFKDKPRGGAAGGGSPSPL